MDPKTEAFEKKIDDTIAKFLPQDKQEKNRTNAWLGTVAATFATGFYTYLIDWNQIARTGAHLFWSYGYSSWWCLCIICSFKWN